MAELSRMYTDRNDLASNRSVTLELPEPKPGQAVLKIERLALTTNNITYAAFGDTPHLRYWDFFPTGEAGWGQMPAWGFADVLSSTVPGVEPGERYYGFWPVASHLVVEPVRVSERGFYDGSAHRLELTSAYNQYQRVSTDAAYRPEYENYQILLRPLFITSFMLADFLTDNDLFGARRVVFSSASSKTAYGSAFCLEDRQDIEVVGLTSASNRAFVEGLGCYKQTVDYNSLADLDPNVPSVYVDFSGNAELRARLHHHLGNQLLHDCYAGSAHSQDHLSAQQQDLPGPAPQPYFAPYQIKKRNSDWGPQEVTRRFNAAQLAFIERVSKPENPWLKVDEHRGLESAAGIVKDLVAGRVDPSIGHVVILE